MSVTLSESVEFDFIQNFGNTLSNNIGCTKINSVHVTQCNPVESMEPFEFFQRAQFLKLQS